MISWHMELVGPEAAFKKPSCHTWQILIPQHAHFLYEELKLIKADGVKT